MAGARLWPWQPLVGQGPWGADGGAGPWAEGGYRVRARKTIQQKQGAQAHRLPQRPLTPTPGSSSQWLSLHGWESGPGRTLLTHGPGAGGWGRLFGPLASLASRWWRRQGRSLSGPGGGNDPQTVATGERPSLFSEILVPSAAPHVLGSLADGASLTWSGELSKCLIVGRDLPYSEIPRRVLSGMDSG